MQIGDTVNLVRRITGELLPVELTKVLVETNHPTVEVRWKTDRHRYKLDLDSGVVSAIDSTAHHRQQMRAWYTISEDHKSQLIELFWFMRKRRK